MAWADAAKALTVVELGVDIEAACIGLRQEFDRSVRRMDETARDLPIAVVCSSGQDRFIAVAKRRPAERPSSKKLRSVIRSSRARTAKLAALAKPSFAPLLVAPPRRCRDIQEKALMPVIDLAD